MSTTKKRRILIVEDTQILRDLLKYAFEPQFELVLASSFTEGMAALDDGTYDAIVSDNDLGSGNDNGEKLLKEAMTKQPLVIRCLMSSSHEPPSHCAHRFIAKSGEPPFQERLRSQLVDLFENQRPPGS